MRGQGPIWYFAPLVVGGFLPWVGLFPRLWRAIGTPPAAGHG